jgi:hypothetical protein
LGDPLKGNLLLFYKPLHLEAQQVSTRIEVRRHQQAEIIPSLLDVAPLAGPPPIENRVVKFCIVPLVAPSQKSTCFDPSGHLKNRKCIFYVETRKTLVAKVVWNAKMHISTKNGTMVPKFAMELAQTMVSAKLD